MEFGDGSCLFLGERGREGEREGEREEALRG
jgi:hypothetical protein